MIQQLSRSGPRGVLTLCACHHMCIYIYISKRFANAAAPFFLLRWGLESDCRYHSEHQTVVQKDLKRYAKDTSKRSQNVLQKVPKNNLKTTSKRSQMDVPGGTRSWEPPPSKMSKSCYLLEVVLRTILEVILDLENHPSWDPHKWAKTYVFPK